MASLTHVCMWSDKSWKPITAEEAAKIHPGGTVSADRGLFMCELCGQYVLLTDGKVQVRHFRHSSAEKSKNCSERTFGSGASYCFNAGDHELPLRIKLTSTGFSFEIGFIRVPNALLTKGLKIEIIPSSKDEGTYTFLMERINADGITYLPVGRLPSEKYSLTVTGSRDDIYRYWPKMIQGIDSDGTIFDATTGKRLVYNSDVEVGKKYFLLKRNTNGLYSKGHHVSVREIRSVRFSYDIWKLYEIVANDYDEESAKFFKDYNCCLTDQPISIQPVWPIYIQTPYVLRHNEKNIIIHIRGYAPNTQVFPSTCIRKSKCGENSIAEVQCNSRQQLISIGRNKALHYTYFWQEPLEDTTPLPEVSVVNLKGEKQNPGLSQILPEQNILHIQTQYDGTVIVKKDGVLVEKRKSNAGKSIEVDKITWGTELSVLVGCDCVWQVVFTKERQDKCTDEDIILKRLISYTGSQIKISHELGSLAGKLDRYPKIRRWLYKCIRDGYMNERAYKELKLWIIQAKKDNGGI